MDRSTTALTAKSHLLQAGERARSLVSTTRIGALREFENVLDSDESWLG